MKEQDAGGRQPVATGPAGLLIIGFHAAGNIEMDDETHIRLVDAHPEGVRRHQDAQHPPAKVVMHQPPFVIGQARMVIADRRLRLPQPARHFLHRPAGGAIDQDRARLAVADQALQCPQLVGHGLAGADGQGQIRPAESRHKLKRVAQRQPLAHVRLDARRGGGGERQAGRLVEFTAQAADLHIVGAEIVAPLGNAVGFIHHQQRNEAGAQDTQEPLVLHALRRHIQQFQPLQMQGLQHPVSLRLG